MNIKKLIAREGLIILGISGLSVFLMWGSSQINKPILLSSVVAPLDDVKWFATDETEAINKIVDLRKKYHQYDDLTNIELAERMAKKYPDWQSVFEVMQKINKESLEKNHEFNYATSKPAKINRSRLEEKLYNLGWVALLFGYPIYLLICFIIWAIKVVKHPV